MPQLLQPRVVAFGGTLLHKGVDVPADKELAA
jgi:hypothetical protein